MKQLDVAAVVFVLLQLLIGALGAVVWSILRDLRRSVDKVQEKLAQLGLDFQRSHGDVRVLDEQVQQARERQEEHCERLEEIERQLGRQTG